MELYLTWHRPLSLRVASARDFIYETELEKIPYTPGVYIFMRVFGENRNPLYVGQALNLRSRIAQQLNVLGLMKGIQNAAAGSRQLVIGEFFPRRGQRRKRCLDLMERALIRHFLSEGYELLNKSGTRLANHSLISEREGLGRLLPRTILFQ